MVALAVVGALAVRAYPLWQNDCISPDGVQYIEAARAFAAGDWTRGLASFYPPGYPLAIAAAFRLVGDWERAGLAVSFVTGVASLFPLVALGRLARLEGAAFAALLACFTVTPVPSGYAASVRSEALYGVLFLIAVWAAALHGVRGRAAAPLIAGLAVGLAYLVRPEGLPLVVPLGAWLACGRGWRGTRAAAILVLVASVVAGPYVLYLHADTGRWIATRKTANVLSLALRSATGEGEEIPQRASDRVPVREVLAGRWGQFGKKIVSDAGQSIVEFSRAAGVAFTPFVALGAVVSWRGSPAISRLIAAVVGFYLAFFTLIHPGVRFFNACALVALVWAAVGLASGWTSLTRRSWKAATAVVTATLALGLVQLLQHSSTCGWTRILGEQIAHMDGGEPRVAATDLRVAFYARGRCVRVHVPLHEEDVHTLLAGAAGWLVASDSDMTPAARTLLDETPSVRLVTVLPVSHKHTRRLYRLGPSS